MSGHSHWATVKHKKGAADATRGQVFSKLVKELTIAAKEGADPSANPRLRTVVEKARSVNMPSANIERAIQRGAGEGAGQLEEFLVEAYGPGNIALLVEGITDNKNRSLGEVKQILAKNQGKFVEGGAVRWLFERRGAITIAAGEEAELAAIEAGAQDLYKHEDVIDVYTSVPELESVKQALAQKGIAAQAATLDWVPKTRVQISEKDRETAEKLFAALDEHDDVQEIYSNL